MTYTPVRSVSFALAAGLLALSSVPARAQEGSPPAREPGRLVDDAWRAVDTTYYDPDFHGVDWSAVGDSFRARAYPSREDAYAGIREMLARLGNPATRFLTPEQSRALVAEFSGEPHEGVGLLEVLSVDTDLETGEIVVVTPVPGGPAARAGLRPSDVIVAVDGADAAELGLAETASRLRGPAGTSVEVTIRRGGETFPVRIERERVPAVEAVEGFVREEGGRRVGYLGLRQFTPDAAEQMERLVTELQARGVEGWVLDLRNDPGGFVPTVQRIGGFFLGAEPLARLKMRGPEPLSLDAQGAVLIRAPVVALVNEGSASAAEVLSSALQAHGRARLVGVHTFGKGLAHGLQTLSDGSAVTPTLGRLETLTGRDVLDEGVEPDLVVSQPTSPVVDGAYPVAGPDDLQYRRAVELLLEEIEG